MNKSLQKIKNSTAALDPAMELAKEEADDKFENFEKIAVNMNGELGAKKQPVPSKPKWSLDESLFDKSISLNEGESLSDREDIQNEIHRYDLLAPRYDKQSIIDELINDGYSYEEAEYIANHTTNLDESLGVSSSVELAARKDVTDYFQKMLYDQFLENPPQAQELDIEINSYDAEWSPQEFDSASEKKFNKVNSLIDQLSIALSDMYFDDSLLESLKEDFVPKYFYRVMKYLYNNDYEGCDEIELEELLMNSPQFHNMSEKTAEAYVEEYLTYYRDPKEFRKLKVDESLNESLSFINNIDKDLLSQASIDPEDCKELITSNVAKCSKSAIHNLIKLLSDGKSATLHLGNFSIGDDDISDAISHVWVESDGKIYQTRVPSNKVKLHSVKEIEFTPDDISNIKSILESNLKGN